MEILVVIYVIIGYWAANRTIFLYNPAGTFNRLVGRLPIVLVFGWLLIPVALIKIFILDKK